MGVGDGALFCKVGGGGSGASSSTARSTPDTLQLPSLPVDLGDDGRGTRALLPRSGRNDGAVDVDMWLRVAARGALTSLPCC